VGGLQSVSVGTLAYLRNILGKAPGTHGAPQYKVQKLITCKQDVCLQVCEIVSVGKYKHAYAFGEFETTKALMLRIGRNERLWRMNVISNHRLIISVSAIPFNQFISAHRFTEIELRE
jgi:hypothetical protein